VSPVIERDRVYVKRDLLEFEISMKQTVMDSFRKDLQDGIISKETWVKLEPILMQNEIFSGIVRE
jgi:hypothetical protein